MDKKFIPNSSQMPNLISDFLIPRISEGEARCIWYICRRTFGFHKTIDRISLSQFANGLQDREGKILDYGTGLSRSSISEALKNLVESGAVLREKDNQGNYYEINLDMNINSVVEKIKKSRAKFCENRKSGPKQKKLFGGVEVGDKGVVRKPNQFGSRKGSIPEALPEAYRKPNTQYIGNKEKDSYMMSLEDLFNKLVIIIPNQEELKREFLSYWTEKSFNGKKELWQMKKVFDVRRRWATWLKNKKEWDNKSKKPDQSEKYLDNLRGQMPKELREPSQFAKALSGKMPRI